MSHDQISKMVEDMEKETEAIKEESLKMAWYMRGGTSYTDVLQMSYQERQMISTIIKENLETTNKSKLTACAKLKTLIEGGRMTINSTSLVSELKTFVAHGISYAAKPGETDDLVMATLLSVRMMQQLQSYHTEMDQQLRDHGDITIEPMPFIPMIG